MSVFYNLIRILFPLRHSIWKKIDIAFLNLKTTKALPLLRPYGSDDRASVNRVNQNACLKMNCFFGK